MDLDEIDTEAAGAHYLRPAGPTHTPPCVIILDSESWQQDEAGAEVHYLRCWDASVTWRRDRRRAGEVREDAGTGAGQLADTIDAWASYGETTWLYAHNVAFDVATTNLAALLTARGWVLSSRHGLSSDGMWCVLHKGRRETERSDRRGRDGQAEVRVRWAHTLTIADSASIWPDRLEALAAFTAFTKPPLPKAADPDQLWADRCHADVQILREAVLGLMDWWDEAGLGKWSVTGAGLGWQTYRSNLGLRQMVIDHDPALIAWEREAVYGGRRDVFRYGQLTPGRWAEADYTTAHLTIAASCPLPARAACRVTTAHRRSALAGKVPAGMLAEVTIRTDTPRWPVRACGRVFYPVGTFKTVLAAPDIQAAADAGALVEVHDGWLYTMTGHLRPWARRCREWTELPKEGRSGIVAAAAKLWSRSVIGKFAQKGWRTEAWAGPPCDGWTVEPCSDFWKGTRGVVTGLCGTYWLSWADQRGEHERPAVLAFVEAHVRSRLGKVLAGPYGAAVVQCDTDGCMVALHELAQLVGRRGRKWQRGRLVPLDAGDVLDAWNEASWPLVMRFKDSYRRVEVIGPQHVVLDGRARMAGVPRSAWRAGDGRWVARLWPGITWQAAHGPPGTYTRPVQPFRVAGPYVPGWVLADGTVRPAEIALDESGGNYLLAWPLTRHAAAGDRLGPLQAAWSEQIPEVCDVNGDRARAGRGNPGPGDQGEEGVAAAPADVQDLRPADQGPVTVLR